MKSARLMTELVKKMSDGKEKLAEDHVVLTLKSSDYYNIKVENGFVYADSALRKLILMVVISETNLSPNPSPEALSKLKSKANLDGREPWYADVKVLRGKVVGPIEWHPVRGN